MAAQRSSRRVALMLSEINKTIEAIIANGQSGSTAHAALLKQKAQLMGLNAKAPKAPSADEPKSEGKSPTFSPWTEEGFEFEPDDVKHWCPECRLYVFADCFPNSLEHNPVDLPRAVAMHNLIHMTGKGQN
jgi:hypothetical protein